MIVYVYILAHQLVATLLLCFSVTLLLIMMKMKNRVRRMIVYVCTVAQLIDGQWQ